MKRVWVIDDSIPVHTLHGDSPRPLRFEVEAVRYLVESVPADQWEERPVFELCQALTGGDFSASFFLSPEEMLRALTHDATPPHAVIFDWEYPGSTDDTNRAALERLLRDSFVYVQIYTHLGSAAVEPKVADLRDRFHGRLLPTKGKAEVKPLQLRDDIQRAWTNTIAGDVADSVRSETFAAVERTLIEIGGVPKDVLTAMAHGTAENLLHLVLAKVRDEIAEAGFEALHAFFSGSQSAESTDPLRRLLSVWYYYFPTDDHVRRGDIIDLGENGDLGFVVTPPCDLVRFPKKTGRRLTWLRAIRLDAGGIRTLHTAGIKINEIGGSIIGEHGTAGDTVILLPNVPLKSGARDGVGDYVILCHWWESRLYEGAPGGPLSYQNISPFSRRCTLADPYASGVISKIMSVISSPGTPDLPQGERARLKAVAAVEPPPLATALTTAHIREPIPGSAALVPPPAEKHAGTSPAPPKPAGLMAETTAAPKKVTPDIPASTPTAPSTVTPSSDLIAHSDAVEPSAPQAAPDARPSATKSQTSIPDASTPPDPKDAEEKK